jgi:hypothetical protein
MRGGYQMDIQERVRNIIINTLIEMIGCRQDEGEMLTEEIISNLEKSNFFIQQDSENKK